MKSRSRNKTSTNLVVSFSFAWEKLFFSVIAIELHLLSVRLTSLLSQKDYYNLRYGSVTQSIYSFSGNRHCRIEISCGFSPCDFTSNKTT